MKVVNLGDPFTKRLTLRLTDLQYEHLLHMSSELETSPSDYVRFLIMQSVVSYDREYLTEFAKKAGGTSDENVKTGSDNNI